MLKGKTILLAILLMAAAAAGHATPEFAEQSGKSCSFCHAGPNGGPLEPVGIAFIRNGYSYPVPERILDKSIALSSGFHKIVRLILGIIHLLTAAILVGTIFYIHIIVKPHNLKGGVPGGERRMGLSCMSILAATGVYLTWYRIDSMGSFFQSRFGVLLFIKILLFIVMVVLGILAVTVITRRMQENLKRRAVGIDTPAQLLGPSGNAPLRSTRPDAAGAGKPAASRGFNLEDLPKYDGKEGRPAYVLFRNKVYDVSASPKWREGAHFRAHAAGENLTKKIDDAPHGEEVLERFPVVAEIPEEAGSVPGPDRPKGVRKTYIVLAYVNLVLVFLILLCVAGWFWGFSPGKPAVSAPRAAGPAEWRLAGLAAEERECLSCHRQENPGIFADWSGSIHAKVGVTCRDCHGMTDEGAAWVSAEHYLHSESAVSGLVSPERCSMCHPQEVEEYGRSKHANTLHIIKTVDNWLIHGMNNASERASGCYACHGTTVLFRDGRPVAGSWPNVGVGRANPDGTFGSCTSCHTRHSFSVEEARKPEACDQCHLGPDHPQIEIYNESKHGTIYHAEGDSWNWRPEDHDWTAGEDYRAPTCSSCHMSEAAGVSKSHDVTERLAWELQAPLTIRPSEFAPWPAPTDWRVEREKMQAVCLQCHSGEWVEGHFANTDNVVQLYNESYYRPVRRVMDELYSAGELSADMYFDEELEWEFYEFWHHEGRRARMGAAMMAPDYAWWHGFYELKHRFVSLMERAREHSSRDRAEWLEDFPGRFGH
ncbi:MAG: CopD family protein [Spirochaetales bacterium]|nr:CopD family protein [Spirochaetales bacterium]